MHKQVSAALPSWFWASVLLFWVLTGLSFLFLQHVAQTAGMSGHDLSGSHSHSDGTCYIMLSQCLPLFVHSLLDAIIHRFACVILGCAELWDNVVGL